jgi:hypothetical protein
MALIRGLHGLCPCPRCLVAPEDLSDLTVVSEARTPEGTRQIFLDVEACRTQSDKESILKKYGLRPQEVCMVFRMLELCLMLFQECIPSARAHKCICGIVL